MSITPAEIGAVSRNVFIVNPLLKDGHNLKRDRQLFQQYVY
jgi:hypothetical protein